MTLVLAAGSGGHLKQLLSLAPRLPRDDQIWITDDTLQSRSLLEGKEVFYFPQTGARDYLSVARNARRVHRLLRHRGVTHAVSTGASIALSVLPVASLTGAEVHYIESATRVSGPSVTGRVLERVPRVNLYTQHPHLVTSRWQYGGSVFEEFECASPVAVEDKRQAAGRLRVVVTVGANNNTGFERLIRKVHELLPRDADVTWQTGQSAVDDLGITVHPMMPASALEERQRTADVIISHAGTGSVLSALECGRIPIVVPRRSDLGEHVDDHQVDLARELDRTGLAIVREANELRYSDILTAVSLSASKLASPPPFRLRVREIG
jgi:UDP-N-acetylglucosamine--N-acetylmuramyl-(pentapeptide) pyrophosphoryl-undecaprenol N-acetylglucosamine transferase